MGHPVSVRLDKDIHSLANSYPYITYAEDGLRPAYRVSLSSKND